MLHFIPVLRRALSALALAAAGCALSPAHAQGGPSQVSLLVPYAPGGPSDSAARIVRPVFEKVLGKTTIVENLAGAGGSLGAARVLRAHDDSQILIGSPNEVILAPLGLAAVKFKPEDFRLVGTVGEVPYVLVGRPDLPPGTVDELIAYSRGRPGQPLTYGSMGPGSLNHLATEAFREKTGTFLLHVPYKGGAPLVQDLLGGQIDIAFTPLAGNVEGLIRNGRLKLYGVTTAKRSAKLQDWPTVNEGKVLKDFVYSIWVGPMVPKGASESFVQRIGTALAGALREPEVRKGLSDAGFLDMGVLSPDEAQKLYVSETRKFQHIAETLRLQPQ